jgi:hypothetical protein
MGESKAECIRNAHKIAALKRSACAKERNNKTIEITRIWREGFKALKDENDRLQKSRDEEYREDMAEVNAWLLDALEGCQK